VPSDRRRVSLVPFALALTALAAAGRPAHAVLDIEDRGPVLEAGRFAMRVTNAGILGNAFFDPGLSFDPSFEFPRGSGIELMNHAELWVGAIDAAGRPRVSGTPILEWRPTPDPADRVRVAWRDRLGSKRLVDDDRDGRVDEEILDDRDDDGDGEVDEDLGLEAHQVTSATYVDDRPEAVNYVYGNGEQHAPLGLDVRQETYAWAYPGVDGIAGLWWRITNHGTQTLRDLHVGVLADLDARRRADRTGHLDDRLVTLSYSRSVPLGTSYITGPSIPTAVACQARLAQTLPAVVDQFDASLGAVALVPLEHTIDPLASLPFAAGHARAPAAVSFRSAVFVRGAAPSSGGLPVVDAEAYAALSGRGRTAVPNGPADWVVLVSCGPFPSLAPGQSIELAAAIVAAASPESLAAAMGEAAVTQLGVHANLAPDSTGDRPTDWDQGVSGLNGHEVCVAAPPGVTFLHDPHCPQKFAVGDVDPPPDRPEVYDSRHCIWTDADCDQCTGIGGRETSVRWLDPGDIPPPPGLRVVPMDHAVRIEWDNRPEVLIRGHQVGTAESVFRGYRVYRVEDWRGRGSLLPSPERWALVSAFGDSIRDGEVPLATAIDTTLDYLRILYEQRLYPVGRYRMLDASAKNGFPYLYTVTSVYDLVTRGTDGSVRRRRLESPLVAHFEQVVEPRTEARAAAGGVWVVPNPFRAGAQWDLPPVDGDRLTRHLDFLGLPRARSTIRVWTLAGDLVAEIGHDGSNGDGQASWDLVSRNGQEVASGIYLFTVDSPLGQQTGRFVVIR
jgi:hypothetical protein